MGDQDQDEALNENLGDFVDCLTAIDPKKDGNIYRLLNADYKTV